MRTDVDVRTEDGTCATTLHTPDGDGPWPAVLVYPDAAGARETFRAMADRLAALGYAVALPDIYYRTPYEPFDAQTLFDNPDEVARLGALMNGLSPAQVRADTAAILDALADRPEVAGTRVGVTGYCMGGLSALRTAANFPERVAAAASFHGGNLADTGDEDSPALFADRMRATVYVAAADQDPFFPADQYERLERALTDAGVAHTMATYTGAAHGFAVPDNPTHDADAEQRQWTALADLYATALRG